VTETTGGFLNFMPKGTTIAPAGGFGVVPTVMQRLCGIATA